jgi:hypothetical protein
MLSVLLAVGLQMSYGLALVLIGTFLFYLALRSADAYWR